MNTVALYDTTAPGSETWNWSENQNNANSAGTLIAYNVVNPVLTVYHPQSDRINGTSVIICPGGGFHFLAIEHEGSNAAKWFAAHGVTAFVLKYRTVHVHTDNPFDADNDKAAQKERDDNATAVIPLAISDALRAVAAVRDLAGEWRLRKDRVGLMGFSAGGLVAIASAFAASADNWPDFVVAAYPELRDAFIGAPAKHSPPLYLTCARDDVFGFAKPVVELYNKWTDAGAPAELHLFSRGGHGFGTGNPGDSTRDWLAQCHAWMIAEQLL